MRQVVKLAVAGAMAAFLAAGCAQKGAQTESESQSKAQAQAEQVAAPVVEQANAVATELTQILFGFDRYDIQGEMIGRVDLNARGISAGNLKVRLEGHTDAFGSDEYNYALGTKRANAVKDALVARGVKAENILLVSYGESKPVCTEPNRECYARNRRVEFVVLP